MTTWRQQTEEYTEHMEGRARSLMYSARLAKRRGDGKAVAAYVQQAKRVHLTVKRLLRGVYRWADGRVAVA